jgi:uncharacterized protein YukE
MRQYSKLHTFGVESFTGLDSVASDVGTKGDQFKAALEQIRTISTEIGTTWVGDDYNSFKAKVDKVVGTGTGDAPLEKTGESIVQLSKSIASANAVIKSQISKNSEAFGGGQ